MIGGYYYMHENKNLIFKRYSPGITKDFESSNFVLKYWSIDTKKRETAWTFLIEAYCLGASRDDIRTLSSKWSINNEDAKSYADFIGIDLIMDNLGQYTSFKRPINKMDFKRPAYGSTALESMAELCLLLGYLNDRRKEGGAFLGLVVGINR